MSLIVILIVIAAVVGVLAHSNLTRSTRGDEWAGPAFASKQLLFSEREFRSERHGLVAKVDRGYLNDDVVELLELKARGFHRVYRSDIIELSVQKLAIEDVAKRTVSETGFVLTESIRDRTRKLHTVNLLGEREILALRDRRLAILDGHTEPRSSAAKGLCGDCAYLQECDKRRTA